MSHPDFFRKNSGSGVGPLIGTFETNVYEAPHDCHAEISTSPGDLAWKRNLLAISAPALIWFPATNTLHQITVGILIRTGKLHACPPYLLDA